MQTSRAVFALALAAAPVAAAPAVAAAQALPVASGASFSAAPMKPAKAAPAAASFLARGSRVRLRVPTMAKDKIAGTVLIAHGDSVVLDTVDATVERRMFFPSTITVDNYRRITLPMSAVDSIEVSTGRSRWSGIRHSARRGALILGLLGAATFRSGDGTPGVRNFAGGYLNGAVVGLLVGGTVGATRGGEHWTTVERPGREATIAAK